MSRKHHHFKGAEVSCCVKYSLFGFNIIFWVSKYNFCVVCLLISEEKVKLTLLTKSNIKISGKVSLTLAQLVMAN